jgi:hypothetical protein
MLKAFNVDFMAHDKITKETIQVATSIRKGFEEAKLIQEGKLKGQSLEDLLNEL